MTALLGEIGKLTAYVEDETVTRSHIDLLVEPVLEAEVWALTDAMAAGRYETALQILRTLLQKQEEPVKILGGMGSQFRRLLAAKRLLDAGKRQQDLMNLVAFLRREREVAAEYAVLADVQPACRHIGDAGDEEVK